MSSVDSRDGGGGPARNPDHEGNLPARRWQVSPRAYRKMVLVAFAALAGIILTGAAVRLTQAGLGCEDWPRCTEDRLVPEWGFHAWIEFGNRLLTGVVAAAVAGAVLTAYRRRPCRRDLILWAWGLVAGVAAQIVLGGMTVLVDLHPLFVAAHFLLSIVLLWNALVLWVRAGSSQGPAVPVVPASVVNHGRAMVGLALAVLVTGTVVTGTGPHGGDVRAERLGFELVSVARVHSGAVWFFTLVTLLLALRLAGHAKAPYEMARWLLMAVVAQGAIGYLQYALAVPAALVEVHIFGSIVVWSLAVLVHLNLFDRGPADDAVGSSDGPAQSTVPDGLAPDGATRRVSEMAGATSTVSDLTPSGRSHRGAEGRNSGAGSVPDGRLSDKMKP